MNVLTPTLGLGVGYSERYAQQSKCSNVSPTALLVPPSHGTSERSYIQSSPYFDPTHTRTGWIGQPPILDRLEVVTDNGDVDTLGQATP